MVYASHLVHRRIQAIHLGEDLVGGFGPDEGLGVVVVLVDIAVDGGLEIDDRVEAAAPDSSAGERREEGLDGVQPRTEVGVKWKVQRGCRSSHLRTLGCLWAA